MDKVKPSESEIKRGERGLFLKGTAPGPGRPELTEEQKLMQKTVKQYIKEHIEGLAQALPEVLPVHIEKAKKGDMLAIKEIYDRVMGKAVTPIVQDIKLDITDILNSDDE